MEWANKFLTPDSQPTSAYSVWHSSTLPRIRNINAMKIAFSQVFQSSLAASAENVLGLRGRICRQNLNVDPDFHGFLNRVPCALWIWLESYAAHIPPGIFRTHSPDSRTVSSQIVESSSPVFIAVCTISEASTGIGYYYCIYINISLYILRRSTQQHCRNLKPHRRSN